MARLNGSSRLGSRSAWRDPRFVRGFEWPGHRDARVRTLVLGALFVREDPHDLPLIDSLVSDQAPTFVHVHTTVNSKGFTGNFADIEEPQTVGQVAEAMLATYWRATHSEDDFRFADYWQVRKTRQTCASWFLVRISRATRNVSPPQPEYQDDVQRVISELQKLPRTERAWTQVFLRCTSFTDIEATLTDATCVAALKEIGSDEIVRFLQRKRVTEDPDLWFDDLEQRIGRVYSWMAHFVLRHAHELLRVQDAPALLVCEEDQRTTKSKTMLGVSPKWAAAAAELIGQHDKSAANQIVADDRFDQADWPSMKWLLAIASDGLPEPLVSQQEMYSVWPPRDGRAGEVMAEWREKLKHHYTD